MKKASTSVGTKRCACTSCHTGSIATWDHFPLRNGGHTSFVLFRCLECRGVTGFPDTNLDIALSGGTDDAIDQLKAYMERPYYTHDNMGDEFEVLGYYTGERVEPGVYDMREVGSMRTRKCRLDAEGRVWPVQSKRSRFGWVRRCVSPLLPPKPRNVAEAVWLAAVLAIVVAVVVVAASVVIHPA